MTTRRKLLLVDIGNMSTSAASKRLDVIAELLKNNTPFSSREATDKLKGQPDATEYIHIDDGK